jgi:hypothetical protein
MNHYPCECCRAVFDHPDTYTEHGELEDCPTELGRCAYLIEAGWRPVWVRVELDEPDRPSRRRPYQVASRGGWLCHTCLAVHLPLSKANGHRGGTLVTARADRAPNLPGTGAKAATRSKHARRTGASTSHGKR